MEVPQLFENEIINQTTRDDLTSLIIWGATVAIIVSIVMFIIGIFAGMHLKG
jgi:hypothetical protein